MATAATGMRPGDQRRLSASVHPMGGRGVFNGSVQRLGLSIGLGWLAWGCLALGAAVAQEMQHTPGYAEGGDPAVAAYVAASERMHQAMAIEFTGNPDVDFARAMIPHHQGAIDMARGARLRPGAGDPGARRGDHRGAGERDRGPAQLAGGARPDGRLICGRSSAPTRGLARPRRLVTYGGVAGGAGEPYPGCQIVPAQRNSGAARRPACRRRLARSSHCFYWAFPATCRRRAGPARSCGAA